MPVNNALHSGQADARPFEILLAMEALEDSKKFIGILGIETHTIVADKNRDGANGVDCADLYHSGLSAAGKFQRITKQIIENQFQQARVAVNLR